MDSINSASGKAHKAIVAAFDDESSEVHPPARRAFIALATELDEHVIEQKKENESLRVELRAGFQKQEQTTSRIQTAIIGAILSLATTVIAAILINHLT